LDSGPEAAGPVHRSHDQPASIAAELLIAFVEASTLIDANVSHDAILRHSDARSQGVVAVVLNRKFFITIRQYESIRIDFPITTA